MPGAVCIIIPIMIALVVGIRLFAGSMDRSRIQSYVADRGGVVVSITWTPFGAGWFGSKNERIYEVVYNDANGRTHTATCKTSMLAGVYFTDDYVQGGNDGLMPPVQPTQGFPVEDESERLRRENQQLRDEIDRLKGDGGGSS